MANDYNRYHQDADKRELEDKERYLEDTRIELVHSGVGRS